MFRVMLLIFCLFFSCNESKSIPSTLRDYLTKTFKTYNGLRSHTYVCQITNNKTYEKNIRDIPSQGELWKMVSKLIADNEKMKNEIKQLRSSILYQQRKIPIMELLKEKSFPQQTYTTWVDSITITQEMLNIVFKDGQLKGVILALESWYSQYKKFF